MTDGTASHTDSAKPSALVQEMRTAQKHAKALVRLIETSEPGAMEAASRASVLADMQVFVDADIPSPRALYRATLAGGLDSATIFVLWNRARKSFMAAGPAVVDMFLAKMENERLPYSERLLVEAMKGMGMLVPSSPVDDNQRKQTITKDAVARMTDEELNRHLLESVDGPQDTEGGE